MRQRNEQSGQFASNGMTHWLIRRAARRAPASLSSRLEEEWLADLETRSTPLSRLRFAVGCCWACGVIVRDHPRDRMAAASAASTTANIALMDRDFGYLSLRSATLFLIAGLHAAILYGLISSLAHTHRAPIPPNLENQPVNPVPPAKLPPPAAPTWDLKRWTIDIPKFVNDVPRKIVFENEVATGVAETPQPAPPPLNPVPPAHVVQKVAGGPGAGFPDTADFYPTQAMRSGEQGLSTIRVCVDPKGELASDPTIVRSSGFARLDQGALKLARAGSGHYRATTEDGQPVTSCYPVGIRFQLKN